MTRIITIETQNDTDFSLLKGLAERLGLRTNEQRYSLQDEREELQLLEQIAGSWSGDESGEQLSDELRKARYFGARDIQL